MAQQTWGLSHGPAEAEGGKQVCTSPMTYISELPDTDRNGSGAKGAAAVWILKVLSRCCYESNTFDYLSHFPCSDPWEQKLGKLQLGFSFEAKGRLMQQCGGGMRVSGHCYP